MSEVTTPEILAVSIERKFQVSVRSVRHFALLGEGLTDCGCGVWVCEAWHQQLKLVAVVHREHLSALHLLAEALEKQEKSKKRK